MVQMLALVVCLAGLCIYDLTKERGKKMYEAIRSWYRRIDDAVDFYSDSTPYERQALRTVLRATVLTGVIVGAVAGCVIG